MNDFPEVPLRVRGFEFVEFASPAPGVLGRAFEALGFVEVGRHRSREASLYRQGGITFIVNDDADSMTACFAAGHGIPATALAIRVDDAHAAFFRALDLGAEPMDTDVTLPGQRVPPLQGVGGVPLYLVDEGDDLAALYGDVEFAARAGCDVTGHGLTAIDHLAYGVYGGHLSYWASLHERVFGTCALRCHDLETARAEGILHIALRTETPGVTLDALRAAGVRVIELPPDGASAEDVPCLRLRMATGCLAVEFTGWTPCGLSFAGTERPSGQRPLARAFA